MKTLLLLLISAVCYGQIDSAWHITGTKLTGTLGTIDTPQTDLNPHHPAWNVEVIRDSLLTTEKYLSLEEKLLLYGEECWNDCEVKYTHYSYRKNCNCDAEWIIFQFCDKVLESDGLRDISHYTKKIIHRKPTFEGFIQWLKKK